MKPLHCLLLFCLFAHIARAQLSYGLRYTDSLQKQAVVQITFSHPVTDTLHFIMPRSIPGRYSGINYQMFITGVQGVGADSLLSCKQVANGPHWVLPKSSQPVSAIRYLVNLGEMEKRLPAFGDASLVRSGYAGLLNYSVFGYVEGMQNQPVSVTVTSFDNWPIFTTIAPEEKPAAGTCRFRCNNYYQLADGQTLLGPKLRVKRYNGRVPLFVADYSETGEDYLDDIGWQGVHSMNILQDYFGDVPFATYTVVKQTAVPITGRQEEAMAMEHLNSTTLLADMRAATPAPADSLTRFKRMFGLLHHMGHAYLPLRCYGDAYKPYVEEVPSLEGNIWFNEGFIWFLCLDTLKTERIKTMLANGIDDQVTAIKRLGLIDLSKLASNQYGEDFRIAAAVFSRGAMMANEMNTFIKAKTGNRKSMKDVLRYLYAWSKKNRRGFTLAEFPRLLNTGAGVDISAIYKKWLLPLE